jgi:hypothetical protein
VVVPLGTVGFNTADLNADGKLDLVVFSTMSNGNGTVEIRLGNGDGTFAASGVSYALVRGADQALIADLNNDTRPDLILNQPGSSQVAVLLGAVAAGTFTGPLYYSTGTSSSPKAMALGLLNADAIPDLVTANQGTISVSLLTGTGTGGFNPPVVSSVGSGIPSLIDVADFNNDGKQDVVVSKPATGQITVLPGTGLGTFSAAINSIGCDFSKGLKAVEMNGDAFVDLVVGAGGGGTSQGVRTLFGTGTGNFTVGALAAGNVYAQAVKDFDGDGKPDLLGAEPGLVGIYKGAANGIFSRVGARWVYGPGSLESIAAGDFNSDGKTDFAFQSGGLIHVVLGDGMGSFPEPTRQSNTLATTMTLGDLNGDGIADLVAGAGTFFTAVYLGNSSGAFGGGTTYSTDTTAPVVIGNFNGDAYGDVAMTSETSYAIEVRMGTSSGGLGTLVRLTPGAKPLRLAAGDLDSDGLTDLVAITTTYLEVFKGTAGGNFAAPTSYLLGTGLRSVAIADLNLDGRPDVVVGGSTSVRALLNVGGAGLSLIATQNTLAAVNDIATGDFNKDGRPDLALALDSNDVLIFLLAGNGALPTPSTVSQLGKWIWVADLEGDGKADLLGGGMPEGFRIVSGNGNGTFGLTQVFSGGRAISGWAVGKVDADAIPDLLMSTSFANELLIVPGLCR